MNDYIEKLNTMFDDEIYDIFAQAKIDISDVMFEYIAQLSSDEVKQLNDGFLSASQKGFLGIAKIKSQMAKIKIEAENWKRTNPETSNGDEISNDTNQNINTLDKPSDYSHLNPTRHKKELFILDEFDTVSLRDDMPSMEFPLFALKSGDTKTFNRNFDNGISIDIRGSQDIGRATIFDKDVWIYCVSKMAQAIYDGKELPKEVQLTTYDYLKFTNRYISGREYINFKNSLNRLAGTRVYTNIKTGGKTQERNWGLIQDWNVIKEDKTKKVLHVTITLPDWLLNSIHNPKSLKKISDDYFRLRKPIDRRIYEIVAKHMGNKYEWKIGLKKLYEKTGASMNIEKFRFNIQSLIKTNELPDFYISYNRPTDIVNFTRRNELDEQALEQKKLNAEKQKKRINSKKQIAISNEFRNQLNQAIKYCPQLKILIEEEFIKKCLKEFSQEQILQALATYKTINVEKINDLNAYFLKMLN